VRVDLLEAHAHRLLGLLADGTGVEQHEVGIGEVVGGVKTFVKQNARHDFRVREIHLAAIALNVKPFMVFIRIATKGSDRLSLAIFIMYLMSSNIKHAQNNYLVIFIGGQR